MANHLGYACINMTLGGEHLPKSQRVCANRTMRKATLEKEGYEYLSEIIVSNMESLCQILEWNAAHGVRLYRMSSEMFPFHSHPDLGYSLHDLPRSGEILGLLTRAGEIARQTQQRLTFHPGPFNVLASANPSVVEKTVLELDKHSEIFDLMGFEPSPFNKINIHVGGSYGDKESALARFCANFARLHPHTQKRLTVENDDRANLYSTLDLYHGVHQVIGIPIVFDYHHHLFNTGGQTVQEALELALSTWPEGVRPCTHYSESRELERGGEKPTPAHSDVVVGPIDNFGHSFDCVVEAKHKEQAVLHLMEHNPHYTWTSL